MKTEATTVMAVTVTAATILLLLIAAVIVTTPVFADRNNKPHNGNTGQCIKINRELDLGGSKQDCRDSFTGKDHNNPPPLP